MATEPRLPEQRNDEPPEDRFLTVWAKTTMLDHDERDGSTEHTVVRGID